MQIFLVYHQPFRRNSVLKCVLQQKLWKIRQKPSFGGSRLFRVIDFDKSQKPVTSACYDEQHVSIYLQPFKAKRANTEKITFLGEGCPSLMAFFCLELTDT